MMTLRTLGFTAIPVVLLTACGGGETSTPALRSYDDQIASFNALASAAGDRRGTPASAVPTGGTFTYNGKIYIDPGLAGYTNEYAGDATVRVNFGASANPAVTGAIANLVDENSAPVTHTLDFSGSLGSGQASAAILGSMSGTLNDNDGNSIRIAAPLLGATRGLDYRYVQLSDNNGQVEDLNSRNGRTSPIEIEIVGER